MSRFSQRRQTKQFNAKITTPQSKHHHQELLKIIQPYFIVIQISEYKVYIMVGDFFDRDCDVLAYDKRWSMISAGSVLAGAERGILRETRLCSDIQLVTPRPGPAWQHKPISSNIIVIHAVQSELPELVAAQKLKGNFAHVSQDLILVIKSFNSSDSTWPPHRGRPVITSWPWLSQC